MEVVKETKNQIPEHHVQQELCETRPRYRQGRKLTAVKAYTINNESQHLLFYNVPALNLSNELKNLCVKYGEIVKFESYMGAIVEEFTQSFHVSYKRIQSARIAKRFLDNKSFYGGILHVCYAPEYESEKEVKMKLEQRLKDVAFRINQPGPTQLEFANYEPEKEEIPNRKRKNENPLPFVDQPSTNVMDYDYKSIGKRKKVINLSNIDKPVPETLLAPPKETIKCEKRIVFHKKVANKLL